MGQGAEDMDMEWARAVPVRAPWPTKDETIKELVEVLGPVTQILDQCLFETILVNGQYLNRIEVVANARKALAKIKETQT